MNVNPKPQSLPPFVFSCPRSFSPAPVRFLLVSDLRLRWLDPRIRLGGGAR